MDGRRVLGYIVGGTQTGQLKRTRGLLAGEEAYPPASIDTTGMAWWKGGTAEVELRVQVEDWIWKDEATESDARAWSRLGGGRGRGQGKAGD